DPSYGRAYTNLGSALATSGDYPEAVSVFEKALKLEPNAVGAHYALGVALRQQSATARRKLPPAGEAKSPGDEAYQRALAAAESGDLAAARDALVEAVRLDEKHADAHRVLGFVLGQQGDLAQAVSHLERAT